ncbi:SDR family NAD(P)-dependent oxidoreductase [Planococcus versutus]|uniref:Short chain dehydrogenase n=1 Tax=Planococcus versutus TaxID=1302659 RepID=A0A1B1RZL7_9BACL|nr:glucose 1-dehydrogenase [Planococcus versutus]ANU26391.1 short chain dehydrogenase [Planococcus versutus]
MGTLMKDKVGIVTAAASGLGRASALAFAAEGAKVVVSDINEEGGKETVRQVVEAGGDAIFLRCNVADEQEVIDLVKQTVEHYGRLDWAHNNAGIGAPSLPIAETKTADWERCIQITQTSLYFSLKHQIPAMLDSGGGNIVNTASTSGLIGSENLATYSAAKWAVNGLTKSVALEYAKKGIRVNSICPGMTLTPAVEAWAKEVPEQAKYVENDIPLGRMALPDEQAQAALWLCSDKSSYITGVNLAVDGGQTAK